MRSCLYEGRVHHARHTPIEHHFEYRLTMASLDLAELDALVAYLQMLGTLVDFRDYDEAANRR